MELVTRRDMDDAREFIARYFPDSSEFPLHDLAQVIADGRRESTEIRKRDLYAKT